VEALLLRGAALQQLKRPEAALVTFRDVLAVSPLRYEAHAGVLDCYVSMRRMREALSQAAGSCKKLSQTPRALTLYAQVLVKEPGLLLRAKSALEKGIAQDPNYLPAIYLLADILEKVLIFFTQNGHFSNISCIVFLCFQNCFNKIQCKTLFLSN
jgi:tetratricopeptide (TPR) repeat protein